MQDVSLKTGAKELNYTGFGATEVSVRREILRTTKDVFSVQGTFVLASNGENIPEASLGSGGNDYELRALWGHSFNDYVTGGFMDVQYARRVRGGPSPDEWRFDATAGFTPRDNWQVFGQVYAIEGDGAQFPLKNYKTVKTQLSALKWIKPNHALQVGAFKTISGQDIIEERGVLMGIWSRY